MEQESDVFSMSIEELMGLEVVSVSRTRGQDVFTSPAAVHVITQEDIRRSGMLWLPELLRMVPGLHVARIDGFRWAISSRGPNGRYARKLLVQMDGRTLYSPLSGGVFWEVPDYPTEDIERIEVIRGPGAALWGANAVDGIINIVTKHAADSQGGLVSVGGGTEERALGTLRYGGRIADNTYYRVYAKHVQRDETSVYGARYTDEAFVNQTGFRVDWEDPGNDQLTLQGDYYEDRFGAVAGVTDIASGTNRNVGFHSSMRGGNVLGRWTRQISDGAETQLQVYHDWVFQDYPEPSYDISYDVEVFDVDFQHAFGIGERHILVWGLGYRNVDAWTERSKKINFDPAHVTLHTYGAFVQDSLTLAQDRLELTLGTKIEHNDVTGFELQPSARVVWTPNDGNTVWAAISRALVTPEISATNATLLVAAVAPGAAVRIVGNKDLQCEEVISHELGYRVSPSRALTLDVTAYYNRYDKLRQIEPVNRWNPLLLTTRNAQDGESHGFEVVANWQAKENWRISAGYTYFKMRLHGGDESPSGDFPRHQYQIRSYYDLTKNVELNAALYYYDSLPNHDVAAFTRLDLGLTWRPRENMEFSLWGQNLIDGEHPEFRSDSRVAGGGGEIQRGVYGKATWRF